MLVNRGLKKLVELVQREQCKLGRRQSKGGRAMPRNFSPSAYSPGPVLKNERKIAAVFSSASFCRCRRARDAVRVLVFLPILQMQPSR